MSSPEQKEHLFNQAPNITCSDVVGFVMSKTFAYDCFWRKTSTNTFISLHHRPHTLEFSQTPVYTIRARCVTSKARTTHNNQFLT